MHTDVKPGDRLFYFTTCGWMMWNWLVSGLASEATLLLYDGSPFAADGRILFDYAEAEKMTIFGTSAKFIDTAAKLGLEPARTHDLGAVKAIVSTGSPLVPESFDYVYDKVKHDVQLASVSGGTDIISCFAQGNPTGPVWRGELQCRGLGMQVEVFDENGRSVRGQKGELVCTAPFPSMPLGFWNDPDGSRYRAAYFERFPGVWCHGDYVELTEHDGLIIYGRSDAVLNPGGVRIGTAEIYRQVERLDEVVESLAIAQQWQNDVRIVLFVRLRDGLTLDAALIERIQKQIRDNASPRHVPARDRAGRGHPADEERQDRRARGAQRRPRRAGEERRGAGEPRSARLLQGPAGTPHVGGGGARLRLGPRRPSEERATKVSLRNLLSFAWVRVRLRLGASRDPDSQVEFGKCVSRTNHKTSFIVEASAGTP